MDESQAVPIIVVSCLAGLATNYLDEAVPHIKVTKAVREGKVNPVSPEQLGGLPTPRTPRERRSDPVDTKDGRNLIAQFIRGAETTPKLFELTGVKKVVLEVNSPSC